jgi:hypothetical protein
MVDLNGDDLGLIRYFLSSFKKYVGYLSLTIGVRKETIIVLVDIENKLCGLDSRFGVRYS